MHKTKFQIKCNAVNKNITTTTRRFNYSSEKALYKFSKCQLYFLGISLNKWQHIGLSNLILIQDGMWKI